MMESTSFVLIKTIQIDACFAFLKNYMKDTCLFRVRVGFLFFFFFEMELDEYYSIDSILAEQTVK